MSYVCITGATSGIGLEFAKLYASKGRNLILVSSNLLSLQKVKEEIQKEYWVDVVIYQVDLSQLDGASKLVEQIKKNHQTIAVLINNAGIGTIGSAECIDAKVEEQMMILNMISVVSLCKYALPLMYQRGKGSILNVASTGAFQPGPYTSSYYASKSFVLSYSRGIRYEAKQHGVNVSVLCPGTTKTNFFLRAGTKTPLFAMSAKKVAKIGYAGLKKKKEIIVPGIMNQWICFVPSQIKMQVVARIKGKNEKESW